MTGLHKTPLMIATLLAAIPLCAFAAWFQGSRAAIGAATGAFVAVANTWIITSLGEALVKRVRTGQRLWIVSLAFVVKTFLLISLVYLLVLQLEVHPIGFAIGVSSFVLGFVFYGFYVFRSQLGNKGYAAR